MKLAQLLGYNRRPPLPVEPGIEATAVDDSPIEVERCHLCASLRNQVGRVQTCPTNWSEPGEAGGRAGGGVASWGAFLGEERVDCEGSKP